VREPAQRGVLESGSNGSISTTQPKRLISLGCFDRSNRSSTRSKRRLPLGTARLVLTPYRSRAALFASGTPSPPTKYWFQFSSQVSTVPHGVTPPAQLLSMPRTRRPVGSAAVFSRSLPAAGPDSRIGVSAVMRRL